VRLKDGRRWAQFAADAIEAAEACGNYVELKLTDGRRPLVRTTLAAAEAELAPHGFLRTHRSWLVRAASVNALTPTGSGDHAVTLASGLSAPLSRRFPQALSTVRAQLADAPPGAEP
jgi:DNA-binding LytR/AlgR family response regulator